MEVTRLKKIISSTLIIMMLCIACSCVPLHVYAKSKNTFQDTVNNAVLVPKTLSPTADSILYRVDGCILCGDLMTTMSQNDLNTTVQAYLAGIVTADMTNYQKLLAVYNWIITNFEYGNYSDVFGYMDCYGYTRAFVYLSRGLGFPSYFVHGDVRTTSGDFTNHAWAIIKVSGTEYLFDPNIEDTIQRRSSSSTLQRFAVTYSSMNGRYVPCLSSCESDLWSRVDATGFITHITAAQAAARFASFVPSTTIESLDSASSNADVNSLLTSPLNNNEFNAYIYYTRYPDLQQAIGPNAEMLYYHYINIGKSEGRTAI